MPPYTALNDRSILFTVCPFILGVELGARFAQFGITSNLVNYFRKYGVSSSSGASLMGVMCGCFGVSTLLGGWIADAVAGRYKTILFALLVYVLAFSVLAAGALLPGIALRVGGDANACQWMLLWVGLLLLVIGIGLYRPNMTPFGAEQFDDGREQDRQEKKSFFNWFYFTGNISGVLASVVLVYLQDQGMWGISFTVAGAATLCSLILFVSGRGLFKRTAPSESVLVRFLRVVGRAFQNRPRKGNYQPVPSSPLERREPSTEAKAHWLDWATESESVARQEVDDAKLVFGVFPILATAVVFWLVSQQTDAFFILQGSQMDRRVSILGLKTDFPAASLIIFNAVSLIIAIPIYDRLVLPALHKGLRYAPTMLQRIGFGHFLSLLAALCLSWIEQKRVQLYQQGQYFIKEDDGEQIEVVELSIFWLAIPEMLIALAEAGAAIGSLEFFYSQAPDSMHSIMNAFNLATMSIAGCIMSLLLYLLDRITSSLGSPWITDNLNEGHLASVYLLLAGLVTINCGYFVYASRRYEYR